MDAIRRSAAALVAVAVVSLSACGSAGNESPSPPPPEPAAGNWKSWAVSSPSQMPVPAPPRAGSARASAEGTELRQVAGRHTPEQDAQVRRWNQEPAVAPWIELSMEIVSSVPKDPPRSSRAYSYVSVAMHDAVVAAWRAKYANKRPSPPRDGAMVDPGSEPSYPSEHAAVAGAASRVLAHLFPEQPAARFDRMAEEAAESRVLAGANYRSDVDAGLELGRSVADNVIALARKDGFERKWDGNRPRGPEHWEPPPGSVALPIRPLAGEAGTWVLESGRQLRDAIPPPPAYGSAKMHAAAREVIDVKNRLTPEQKRIAKFWEGAEGTPLPAGIWNQVVLVYVRQAGLSTPRAARTFALLNIAMADAGVACWYLKSVYWHPRPVNAIPDLGIDRRWTSFLPTPFFPAYPSGTSSYSGAAGEVLAHLFPADAELFRSRAEEAANSRLLAGVHWRYDNENGLRLGREVGRLVVEEAKKDGAEG